MTKKLWGGRFKKKQDPLFWKFQSSIDCDKVLAKYDVLVSIAHAKMLGKCGIIPRKKADSVVNGLLKIRKQVEAGSFKIAKDAEDVHSAVYDALTNIVGCDAEYLHTARSRNDLVVTDVKMYCKDSINEIRDLIVKFQAALLGFAKKNIDVIMPGLTHTQHAMPVLLSHQALAYVTMLERDIDRLTDAYKRCDEMPLGSCALSGTSFLTDRKYTAKLLGFSRLCENSIDAVSDRDFIIEILSAISLLFTHLSRFCEDMILFSTPEYGLIDIGEEYCTGSSIMPQKKNPDSLELIRGICAKSYGNLISVLTMMKGLPLSYNRDMQYDKEPLFSSVELSKNVLSILSGLVKTVKVNKGALKARFEDDQSIFAVDIADYLVLKGISFSRAHQITGNIVSHALQNDMKISAIPLSEFRKHSPKFDAGIYDIFDAKKSVTSKRSIGSTNPILVRQQIDKLARKKRQFRV